MNIQLCEHFTYKKLLRFSVPSIIMMIFTSIYGVVDGIFVSNFVGKTPFAAINLIMPVLMLVGSLGFMIGTGGSALVSKIMGAGDTKKANGIFSMLIYVSSVFAVIISAIGFVFIEQIASLLGAEGEMLADCVLYSRILLPFTVAFVLQNEFQSFLIAAEKPQLGLFITVAAGVTNIVLDALFIAVFNLGLAGAAWATGISQCVGGIIPLIYFIVSKKTTLRLSKADFDIKALIKTCTNGSSEMMTNLSMSTVNMLYNFQLMNVAGENGIAAYGVIMYVNFIFVSVFLGYSIASAPIISFHYGAENHGELKNLLKKSLVIISVFAVVMTAAAEILAKPLSGIFVSYDRELFEMTTRGFMLFSLSFIFMGFNIFGSSFFTALNNGLVSAIISFARTLLFQVIAVLTLPLVLGLDGIWLAVVAAELISIAVTVFFTIIMKKKYNY